MADEKRDFCLKEQDIEADLMGALVRADYRELGPAPAWVLAAIREMVYDDDYLAECDEQAKMFGLPVEEIMGIHFRQAAAKDPTLLDDMR